MGERKFSPKRSSPRTILKAGQELMVQVEQVFDGGLVVRLKDSKLTYRGALLSSVPFCLYVLYQMCDLRLILAFFRPILKSPEVCLANPLSVNKDHPYSKGSVAFEGVL